MASTASPKWVRKTHEHRRAEIVDAAADIALTEGLECVTGRRVADALGVRQSLIGHYFPTIEDLVAEAFGQAASSDMEELLPNPRATASPLDELVRFFEITHSNRYDMLSRLWLNARHLCRYRPTLRERVNEQERLWGERFEALVLDGVEAGQFSTDNVDMATTEILVVIDGLSTHANTDLIQSTPTLIMLAATTAERVLGLEPGTLTTHVSGKQS